MTDYGVITSKMLLEHMQAQKNELLQAIRGLDRRVSHKFDRLEKEMKDGFEEARLDRRNLWDDLKATMRMQFQHQKQLAVLTGGPLPEEY